ncbi:MAG: NAD-dependent deacylase [Paludibacteraceae bacterium]|nr:NAD-dependent deacylase [Paludibacteraceae bacterium]
MKRLVVLTGAGMSAESGFSTFRDNDGLWEKYNIEDVCTPRALVINLEMVLEFYNGLRRTLENAKPNRGHKLLAELEQWYDVQIITQNVDDLHERAGSTNVLHLHGELTKACDMSKLAVKNIGYDPIRVGDTINGSQARPYIVFFEEDVPLFSKAVGIVRQADIFVVIGTSLNVYPAAGLINYVPQNVPIYIIDPKPVNSHRDVICIQKVATDGCAEMKDILLKKRINYPLVK